MGEILNIDHHKKRLVIKAVSIKPNDKDAAKALGVHVRTLYKMKKKYGLVMRGKNYVVEPIK